MPKWELKRVWMPVTINIRTDKSKQHEYRYPAWNEETKKAWGQAEVIAAEGWEFVSALPEIGSHELGFEAGIKALGVDSSCTVGNLLIFKRPNLQVARVQE